MAEMMDFRLLAPDREVMACAASEIEIPGTEGDFTALPGHMPFITALRPGIVRVQAGSESREFVLSGGFVEVSAKSVTILAEQALARDGVTQVTIDGFLDSARNDAAGRTGADRDLADRNINGIVVLARELGLQAGGH